MKGKDEVMRSSGVLMHISSLPSPYGIGTMGKEARKFADFLEKSGQKYWQILPICPTSYGDSPYQSFSSFAGNPYFIDLEYLCKEKLLKKAECESFPWGKKADKVDYGVMYESRYKLLKIAFERFLRAEPDDFEAFCEKEADWLSDYALFMALKDANGGNAWFSWEKDLKMRKPEALAEARSTYAKDIRFYQMLQYLFFKQWWELKAYVNEKGIEIIGDVPIYVAGDSADVWANPEEFYLDEDLNPIDVAGCPPDAFSEDGQLWGNPAKDKTAKNGEWRKGPGMDLFHTLEQKLGRLNIIVEDLGFLTPSVLKLVADSGFPGMKVIQFAFDSREGSNYLPHTYTEHCVVYTGTHDNDTLLGWMKTAPKESVKFAKEYLNLTKEEGYNWGMMRGAWSSVGELAVVPMQDLIGLGSEARMNTPSTLGGNWQWRATSDQITVKLAKRLYNYMEMYGRLWVGEDADRKEQ